MTNADEQQNDASPYKESGVEEQKEQQNTEADLVCPDEIFKIKWRALVLICLLTFGGYYIYDFPGSLGIGKSNSIESWFAEHDKDFTSEMNQALYSIYSWPNTVVATFGGILIDNIIGLRKALMLFVCLDAIGAAIFYFGVLGTNYPVMLLGRLVFGLGNESLSVAQNAYVAKYFLNRWGMSLAFGIVISFSRVGSSFNFLFSPKIAKSINVETAVLFGVFACALSVVAAILLIFLDLYCESKELVAKEKLKNSEDGKGSFKLSDFKALNKEFFCIAVICIAIYCALFPFIGIAAPFIEVKYDVSSDQASTYVSFFQFACAGFSPFTGGVVDRFGRNAYWLVGAGSGFTLVHLLFLVAKPNVIPMTIFMGVVYSVLAASLWPAVPLVVQPNAVGLAYGALNSLQNAGLAIFPLISGAILTAGTPARKKPVGLCYNWTHDDFNASKIPAVFPFESLVNCTNNTDAPLPYLSAFDSDLILFMATAATGVGFSILLAILSKRADHILVVSNVERKAILKEKLARWKEEEAEANALAKAAPEGISTAAGNYGTETPTSSEKAGLLNPEGLRSGRASSASMQRYNE
jgi:MFS family permease